MNNTLVRFFGWRALIFQHIDPSMYDRWKWLDRHLEPSPQRTLDAGCGAGEFTLFSAHLGHSSLGISFDERLNHIARTRAQVLGLDAEFVTADLRNLDQLFIRLGTFDQIICMETIEHITNDQKLIADLARLLKSNGRLFLTAPVKDHRPLIGEALSKCEDGGHVRWGYTQAEIAQLFRDNGLELAEVEYLSGFVTQQLINLTNILGRIDKRLAWGIVFPLRLFQHLDPFVSQHLNSTYLSIGAIGIRRA